MITVGIFINGNPIVAINAVNKIRENKEGETLYLTTEGKKVWHRRSGGAIALAKKLLDCIENDDLTDDQS